MFFPGFVRRNVWAAIVCAALPFVAFAQEDSGPKGRASLHVASLENEPQAAWAVVRIAMQPGWHVYWQNAGDSGIPPTIDWALPDGMTAGPIHWPAPHRIEFGGLYNYGYEGEALLPVPLKFDADADGDYTLRAKVSWLICKDICIPESAEIEARFSPGQSDAQAQALANAALETVPQPLGGEARYDIAEGNAQLHIDWPKDHPLPDAAAALWFFPADDGIFTNGSAQQWERREGGLTMTAERGSAEEVAPRGHLQVTKPDGSTQHWHIGTSANDTTATPQAEAHPAPAASSPKAGPEAGPEALTFAAALLAALLGGIILNVMPCVLPILSLKALSISKKAAHEAALVRRMGLAYTAGILACFLAVAGMLIVLQQAGQAVGWGFQLQSPHFVLLMCYLMFAVALNLSGIYELPNLGGSAAARAHGHPLTESFFTGALAALIATPCTAPFMATGIGYALGQPPAVVLLIFGALGFGLALPYLLICFVPTLHRLLPKPGAWMVRLRQLLAFPIYATACWLLWVLVQQSGPMGLAQGFFGLCLIGFGVWVIPLFSRNRFVQIMLVVVLGGLLLRTVEQQSITQGFVPVQQSELKDHYSEERLRNLLAEKKPVFVYATAAWCITCKVNERVALDDASVQTAMKERGITTLVADWTGRDEAITRYLASFGRNGVPIYVYYAPGKDPQILPQVLTPGIMLETFTAP